MYNEQNTYLAKKLTTALSHHMVQATLSNFQQTNRNDNTNNNSNLTKKTLKMRKNNNN